MLKHIITFLLIVFVSILNTSAIATTFKAKKVQLDNQCKKTVYIMGGYLPLNTKLKPSHKYNFKPFWKKHNSKYLTSFVFSFDPARYKQYCYSVPYQKNRKLLVFQITCRNNVIILKGPKASECK